MPTKIVTERPQIKRRLIQTVIGDSFSTVVEAPYFSLPDLDDLLGTEDPDDPNRELRPGEIYLQAAIVITNTTGTSRTVDVEIVGEDSTATSLASSAVVPANEVLALFHASGHSLFKADLANPGNAGGLLRVKADQAGALTLTVTVVEREAIDHAPDTENI